MLFPALLLPFLHCGWQQTAWTQRPDPNWIQLFLNLQKSGCPSTNVPASHLGLEDTHPFSNPRPPWTSPCTHQSPGTGEGKLQSGRKPRRRGPACQARLTTALTPEEPRHFPEGTRKAHPAFPKFPRARGAKNFRPNLAGPEDCGLAAPSGRYCAVLAARSEFPP